MDKVIGVITVLAILGIIFSMFYEYPRFMSQCAADGHTDTECRVMWSEMNRSYD